MSRTSVVNGAFSLSYVCAFSIALFHPLERNLAVVFCQVGHTGFPGIGSLFLSRSNGAPRSKLWEPSVGGHDTSTLKPRSQSNPISGANNFASCSAVTKSSSKTWYIFIQTWMYTSPLIPLITSHASSHQLNHSSSRLWGSFLTNGCITEISSERIAWKLAGTMVDWSSGSTLM
ncbi:hypothetical protein ASPSYDRAFT_474978 [Aspergillus sydowii CBS 593.65]|uniref:Uncharacterized protein n=1 Tax=Aspergillus sydowii CBS 593.65 TaxID=1036612 RepID=A0A1L9T5K0_9EURO|nr:uncharacterized protein ASPSYDRAFT_474978 [Aspergillus sydowii CBS 593.65]OJJ54722.1 hypothetical protein ASPSYDRAFT_474978 [Aspergillus sydowii CBS 593.65]